MRRVTLLYLFAALAALLSPAVANAAPRMYVGFHDDPNFRYEERRASMLDQVRSTHAGTPPPRPPHGMVEKTPRS